MRRKVERTFYRYCEQRMESVRQPGSYQQACQRRRFIDKPANQAFDGKKTENRKNYDVE
jgi:hypothetical protein